MLAVSGREGGRGTADWLAGCVSMVAVRKQLVVDWWMAHAGTNGWVHGWGCGGRPGWLACLWCEELGVEEARQLGHAINRPGNRSSEAGRQGEAGPDGRAPGRRWGALMSF